MQWQVLSFFSLALPLCICVCVCVSEALARLRYLTRRLINIEMTLGREVQRFTSGERRKAGKPKRGRRAGKEMSKWVWMVAEKKSGEIRKKKNEGWAKGNRGGNKWGKDRWKKMKKGYRKRNGWMVTCWCNQFTEYKRHFFSRWNVLVFLVEHKSYRAKVWPVAQRRNILCSLQACQEKMKHQQFVSFYKAAQRKTEGAFLFSFRSHSWLKTVNSR